MRYGGLVKSVSYCYANCVRDDIDQQCEGGLAPAPPLTPVSRGLPNKAVQGAAERLRNVGPQLTNTECKQFGHLLMEVSESSSCLINTLMPSGYYMYHKVSHSKILRVCIISVWISEQTAIISLYNINPLKTKRRLLYLKTQSVPRCKPFSSRL